MFERIKKIYSKWWLRQRVENQSQLTDRGQYILKYIINKYINEQNIEEISSYEKVLEGESIKNFSRITYKTFFHDEDAEKLHIFSAICYIVIALYTLNEDEENEVLSWIEPERIDAFSLVQKLIKARWNF